MKKLWSTRIQSNCAFYEDVCSMSVVDKRCITICYPRLHNCGCRRRRTFILRMHFAQEMTVSKDEYMTIKKWKFKLSCFNATKLYIEWIIDYFFLSWNATINVDDMQVVGRIKKLRVQLISNYKITCVVERYEINDASTCRCVGRSICLVYCGVCFLKNRFALSDDMHGLSVGIINLSSRIRFPRRVTV